MPGGAGSLREVAVGPRGPVDWTQRGNRFQHQPNMAIIASHCLLGALVLHMNLELHPRSFPLATLLAFSVP